MDTLEFYGGVNEIGGNKIKLNLDSSSLLLDFGMSFSQSGKYFAEFMNPRKGNGLEDYIELGLLPKVKGIYREDYLRHKAISFDEKPSVDGLLLSHAHADHADYINFLREDIPLYMSLNSKIILEVIDSTGNGTKEILTYKPQFKYYLNKKGNWSKVTSQREKAHLRDIHILKPYKSENINDLKVQLAPVDHSLPGAAAFLIEGNEERVVYTGDLRFHGRNKKDSEKFVKKASKFSPNILICEGTRINEGGDLEENNLDNISSIKESGKLEEIDLDNTKIDVGNKNHNYLNSEEDIEREAYNLISEEKNSLVIANFPLRDLDRLITFYNIAKSTDRTLLINFKQAYMLKRFEEENGKDTIYPSLNDEHIKVYLPRKENGLYLNDTYALFEDEWRCADRETSIGEYSKWEKEFIDENIVVSYKDIKDNENQYILRLDNFSFTELIDIKPNNAIYIHSVTEPFNDEMELDFKITENWLRHFNINIYKPYHVSGHARGPELLEMIRAINPDILYPVHTTHIDLFDILKEDGIEVIHPKRM